ncbi:MAG TPA: pinensin family lanthipeptide [Longimicrobium sp.]
MKKLTLKVDDLKVHSFETAETPAGTGTVHGNVAASGKSCNWSDCWSCGIWCPETTNPDVTGPCNCPVDTEAPVC